MKAVEIVGLLLQKWEHKEYFER